MCKNGYNFQLCLNIIQHGIILMVNDITLTVIAIVAVIGLLGLVVVETVSVQQQAEARGCPPTTPALNASKGRCFGH